MQRWLRWFLIVLVLVSCTSVASDDSADAETQETPPSIMTARPTPTTAQPTVQTQTDEAAEAAGAEAAVAAAVASAAETVSTADAGSETEDATPAVTTATYATATVGEGDTLLGLALDHGIPMAAIQLQNDLGTSTMVQLGQELVIPPASAWEGASPFWIVHVVSEGETLSGIAQAYGLTLDQMQGTNGLADADLLSIGQPLVLPLNDFAEAQPVAPAPEAVAAQSPDDTEEEVSEAPEPTSETAPEEMAPEPTPTSAPAPPPAEVTAWAHETVRIINEVRAAHGLPPLAYNETLAQAAQVQADDCAARGSCSHTGSDGSTIKERILRVGYMPASWAECWAVRPSPQAAVDIWMDEVPPNDPHRRTLLTTWLTEIGLGVSETRGGYYYFIADFGKPLR